MLYYNEESDDTSEVQTEPSTTNALAEDSCANDNSLLKHVESNFPYVDSAETAQNSKTLLDNATANGNLWKWNDSEGNYWLQDDIGN